jgi:3-mercaptopyruvate sulfurtransferase SseA
MPTHDQLRELIESESWLIEADQLEGLLGEPSVKVFDVRGTWSTPARALSEDYAASHIPGAVFLDWTAHFIEQGVALAAAAVADEASAKQAFKTLGINEGDLVVLYDDNSHMFAGRIWWAMRYWGFAGVRVLNGGWKNWSAQKKPVSNESPQIAPGPFQPHAQEIWVFDERAPEWHEAPIITTCGAGYSATVILLALSQIDRTGRLFDGSFAVWKQDPDRPVSQSKPT